jgi:hypothetical protein
VPHGNKPNQGENTLHHLDICETTLTVRLVRPLLPPSASKRE